ncbi:MAG: metal-dependent transcriptional regulator [Bacteroidia bacterium]|nr:metal-dependent transcriptional regulator [Bacteroidia bacterium]
MKLHTETEENYLKCILRYSQPEEAVSTNTIANSLGTSPASVTDMLKKLSDKHLVQYQKYRGAVLTEEGRRIALSIVRKHRLWEVFLVDKLHFSWDNVHEVAEQLEHINSPELVRRIDAFLGFPKFDPHGDPIPSETGEMVARDTRLLAEVPVGEAVCIASVCRSDPEFLQYLDRAGLTLNQEVTVSERLGFDESLQLAIGTNHVVVSGTVARNLLVVKVSVV